MKTSGKSIGRVNVSLRRKVLAFGTLLVILAFSIYPAMGATTFGRWRDINPTQYSADITGTLRGVYMSNGGSGSIGAGDGWVVGGDDAHGIISHYDGFSWQILTSPYGPSAVYNSVNFCQSPGAPNLGSLCTVTTIGNVAADGWLVGTVGPTGTTPIATYWDGYQLTEVDDGLALAGAGNLTSVFVVCHSVPFSLGCSGSSFASGGLTFAVGSTNAPYPTGNGIICEFNGNPKGSGSWTCPIAWQTPLTHRYNSVYMYVDQAGNLGGFAVGDNGYISQYSGGGWAPPTQYAPGVNFRSVFVDQEGSNLDAWAVGDFTAGCTQFWHYQSGTWGGPLGPCPGPGQNLESVFLVSTSEGWAVGSGSTIFHATTLSSSPVWSPLTTPTQTATGIGTDLIGVSFTGSGNGWAVGTSGVILNTQNSNCGNTGITSCWGGNTGITQTANLTAVFEVSQSDTWAGGWWDFANNQPTLIHWDGQKWHRAQITPPATLTSKPFNITSIYMSGSSDGWAVGGKACTPPGPFPCVTPPEVPFTLHWNGNAWDGQTASQPTCLAPGCSLTSVFMINSGEGWAVGDGGQFFHYTTGTNQWGLVQTLSPGVKLNSVFINNPGNTPAGWAVGNGGTIAYLQISGGTATWIITNTNLNFGTTHTQNLYGVYFTDSNHGWIVGAQGTILATTDGGAHWSGGSAQVNMGPTLAPPALRSVSVDMFGTGPGSGDGWAVGDTCTLPCDPEKGSTVANPLVSVFAHWDGQSWTYTTINPPIALGLAVNSVTVHGTQDGWAVGAGPTVTPPPVPLAGIYHLDPLEPPVSGGGGGGGGGATTVVTTFTPATGGGATTVATTIAATTASGRSVSTVTNILTTGTTVTGTSNLVSTASMISTSIAVSTALIYNTLEVPGIPGFPWESIMAGIMIGLACIGILRRIRKR
ncbi:MAG: YCF48-related protein [Candidatus Bathyarchaeia archaeon]